jgi:hypothetical protein
MLICASGIPQTTVWPLFWPWPKHITEHNGAAFGAYRLPQLLGEDPPCAYSLGFCWAAR